MMGVHPGLQCVSKFTPSAGLFLANRRDQHKPMLTDAFVARKILLVDFAGFGAYAAKRADLHANVPTNPVAQNQYLATTGPLNE
jgi:hypothetical protein